ncbi:MAG: hypothetical protein ABFD59_08180 [Smithella sp.]
MTAEEKKDRFITWSWIAGILLTVLVMFGGYMLTDTRAEIKSLQQVKLDKEDYYRDIDAVKKGIDKLINMHMEKK